MEDIFKVGNEITTNGKNLIVAKLELINIDLRYMMSISGKSKDAYGYCIDKITDLIDGL